MSQTPIYAAVLAGHSIDPGSLTDLSPRAIEARATADDAERGRALVARLEGGDRG